MFRILAAVIFVVVVAIGFSYRYRSEKSGERISWAEEGAAIMISLRLAGLLAWLSIVIYLINPGWLNWSSLNLPTWTRWAGATIALICVPLVYWLLDSIGRNITQTVKTREHHELVTKGPYRWVRHPLYSVGTLLFIGFGLMASNWFIILVTLLCLGILMARLPMEERNLVARFGDDYRQYMTRTGRLIPRLRAGR